jgi:hypothetical protein
MGHQGQVCEVKEVPGFHPGPRPGGFASWTSNKGRGPLQSVHWLGNGRGPTVAFIKVCVGPLPFPNQNEWFQGPLPLVGSRGNAPGGFEGGALALPWLRHLP